MSTFTPVVKAQIWEVGVFGGVSYYTGDLNPWYHFRGSEPAYGGLIRYNHGTRWAFEGSAIFGRLQGSDELSNHEFVRDLAFESKIMEFSARTQFHFLNYIIGSKRSRATTYIFAGVAFFTFNPTIDGIELRPLGTEGQNIGFEGREPYDLYSFSMPFGIGVKYSVSSRLGVSLEWGMRKTLTDYIDDVSTTYYLEGDQINPDNRLEYYSDPTGAHQPYMHRGNSRTNDWYNFTGVTITYKFRLFRSRKCIDQRRVN